VTTKTPAPAAPEIAPIADLGVPGFEAAAWQMVVAPANTPREIVERLHTELKAIMATADARQQVEKIGLVPVESGAPAELARFVAAEIARWAKVVEASGATVD
jgi:tripartite-type tricarboxylate transporter receptor subunit TctC